MEDARGALEPIVLVHKDHPLHPWRVNAGAETATLALARALAAQGRKVILAAELPDEVPTGEWQSDGICYLNFGRRFETFRVFSEAAELLQNRPYHLIVACKAQALLESRAHQGILTRLFITHEPSAEGLGVRPDIIAEAANRMICVSNAQAELLVKAGCPKHKIAVVPNGVDLDTFYPGAYEARDLNRLVFVGALVVDKGLHLLLEAFSRLKSGHPGLKLDVYGTAALWGRADYLDLPAIQRSLPDVTFHGAAPQSTIAEALRTAGIMVQPSIYFESFSLSTVEAQASGLPVIGSVNGGMTEIIVDGITGRLINPTGSDVVEAAISSLLADPALHRSMSEAAAERTRTRFSWAATAERIAGLFNPRSTVTVPSTGANTVAPGKTSNDAATSRGSDRTMSSERPHIGFLSTFNQECGLATYGGYLVEGLADWPVTILAEDVSAAEIAAPDTANVRRCWHRQSSDYDRLSRAVKEAGVDVLHLNCHYRFFHFPAFGKFLTEQRMRGVQIVTHLHTTYTVDPSLEQLVKLSDRVLVHTPENKLEAVANGAEPEVVRVIPHGVLQRKFTRDEARTRCGIAADECAVVCFGFVQAHKGIDEVIAAVHELRTRYAHLNLYVVGGPHREDPHGTSYYKSLRAACAEAGLGTAVHFVDGFVAEELVDAYLAAADAVVMNYKSMHYEASGALARALGCGSAVITSSAPAFAGYGDAVFHVTSGYPLTLAIELVTQRPSLNDFLRNAAQQWSKENSWTRIAERLAEIYTELPPRQERRASRPKVSERRLRVLMQNRAHAFTHRGGDTVTMERVRDGLLELGVEVDIDLDNSRDLSSYDIIHLHNFATPESTEAQARRASAAGKPFVVTTLYEDLPLFFNQMIAHFKALKTYVDSGQSREQWPQLLRAAKQVAPCSRWENEWTANNAALLLATGQRERNALERDYPKAKAIEVFRIGSDLRKESDEGATFFKERGLEDFILCVGRLETRKNQLSLLKALEDSDLPVVFVTGGFTYQPEYEELCRKFKRRGPTVFLGRLDETVLAAAYRTARVHALPSWYELPGLVSLEARAFGKAVVATDYGTARDYLGQDALYCDPGDPESIYNAVLAAYYRPVTSNPMPPSSWSGAAEAIAGMYEQVLSKAAVNGRTRYELPEWHNDRDTHVEESLKDVSQKTGEAVAKVAQIAQAVEILPASRQKIQALELCNAGDACAKRGAYEEALGKYRESIMVWPECARAHRSRGAMLLQQGDTASAETAFREALRLERDDAKAMIGIASCKWNRGERAAAFEMYREALHDHPGEISIVLHLVSSGYALQRMSDLEDCLTLYLSQRPDDLQIQYCLAGCLFKQDKLQAAHDVVERILEASPSHADALELWKLLEERMSAELAENGQGSGTAIVQVYKDPHDQRLHEIERKKETRLYQEAAADAESFLKQGVGRPEQRELAEILRAECLARMGEFAQADDAFASLTGQGTYRSRAYAGRGVVAAARERWSDAAQMFNEALAISPANDVAQAGLGICELKCNNLEMAWNHFARALELNGENVRALMGIIQVGYPLKRLGEMEEMIRRYLEVHPANLSILYAHAGCLYALGKRNEARAQVEKVLMFEPGHRLAGELLERLRSEGRSPGQKAEEISPAG